MFISGHKHALLCSVFTFGFAVSTSSLYVSSARAATFDLSPARNLSPVSSKSSQGKVSAEPDTSGHTRIVAQAGENIIVNAIRLRDRTSPDTTSLFRHSLGFSSYSAGGVSALPVLNGMADDRIATIVDGMRIASACPNHMNPALSYVDPDSVATAQAIAGITPVSIGGDSTGGSIVVERRDPLFAEQGKLLVTGHVRGDYRSNGGGSGASGTITVANDTWSLRYTGSYAHASNYRTGGNNSRQVRSTSYLSFNHAVTAGFHKDNHQASITFGQQDIPYEGFPNQYMDMTNNRSTYVNGKYKGDFDWGSLEARAYWQRVDHVMNMMNDKGGHTATTGMPMNTDSRSVGYSLKAIIPLAPKHTLTLGSEFEHNGLNDWWPPLTGSMMMGPNTFHNINNGHRDRLGHYAEWNAQWLPRVSTLLGFRSDLIMMNTGQVAPYSWTGMMSMADAMAAQKFNAASRGRTDTNFDVTALVRWHPLDSLSIEGGYARKTRSPNLYERYSWAQGTMATSMIGWFGDGNGYVGNLNLTPEVANTASFTVTWHDPKDDGWEVKVQPYYTYTHNYINVVRIGSFSDGLSKLQFVNHNAQSYGINSSVRARLWKTDAYGTGEIRANLNWVRGQDLQNHSGLYHQMPTNGTVGLYETYQNWTGRIETTLVKSKNTVDWIRNEPRTPGYVLLGLGGSYRWRNFLLDASIENICNQKYYLPLGGMSLGDYDATGVMSPLQGMGRSFNVSLTASF
ncbi:TonB-dependent receptor [Acetobacter sp.]|jgi:iron complex outermembrane receptor protein|uniref:TonB-dependent receptor n=1 Tax=Acetobacter sp. TaxID=440 RepID=UPI0025BC2EAB|nr:TonB-dependent receptor [Acetobacter sp.]MCH4090454.1 TonB-dependent receptor plug domain-containing protein [Acetobacter sp.]MCI1299148.1 TonB-dependent receptor plug domain-containing protein [Acetobacter sp.]MCI1315695.1 TonB-dependent receptor plug domain-containing protein [Acetobacter sp.]